PLQRGRQPIPVRHTRHDTDEDDHPGDEPCYRQQREERDCPHPACNPALEHDKAKSQQQYTQHNPQRERVLEESHTLPAEFRPIQACLDSCKSEIHSYFTFSISSPPMPSPSPVPPNFPRPSTTRTAVAK